MQLIRMAFIVVAAFAIPAAARAQTPVPSEGTILRLSIGWNLVAGSANGVDPAATFYTLADDGVDYLAVSNDQLQDFKAYWLYVDHPTELTVEYAIPQIVPQQKLSCRSDQDFPCSPTPSAIAAIPVPQERWTLIGNSSAQPIRLANIFYDVNPRPGVTVTFGYLAQIYDPASGSYKEPLPAVVRGTQVGALLRPGEGAWVKSPIEYVFLESLPAQNLRARERDAVVQSVRPIR